MGEGLVSHPITNLKKTYIYDCVVHGDVWTIQCTDINTLPYPIPYCSVVWCNLPVRVRKAIFNVEIKEKANRRSHMRDVRTTELRTQETSRERNVGVS